MTTLKDLALQIETNYAAGMSGMDEPQLQLLVELGDRAKEIIEMADELEKLKGTRRTG